MARFFVYDLVDPRCGSTFYVGKGCKNRPADHIRDAERGTRSRKCNRIREILEAGETVKVGVIQRFETEDEAYAFEVERIAEFGLANLTNVLPGGRGGMAKAVRLAELMPRSMMLGLYKVFLFAAQGKRVFWGGMDVTEFAETQLRALVKRHGIDAVNERFKASNAPLLTIQNNAI